MLIAGTLSKAHRGRQIHLAMSVSRLVDTLSGANQVVLLMSELILLLIVHHWGVVQFALLMLVRRGPAGGQVL